MEILFFVPIIILCLFILYLLSRHDFVLLRQNISLAQIFDIGIISIIAAFFVSRFLFVVNSGNFELLNILSFLHIARYPGLSSLGFLMGGVLALSFLFRKKKSIRRIYDIFTISFMPIFAFNLLLKGYPQEAFYIPLAILILMAVLFVLFIKTHSKYILKDGTISYFFVLIVSLNSFFSQTFDSNKWMVISDVSIIQILSIFFILSSFIFLIQNQKVFKS